jgi:hypothetical protein
MHFVDLKLLPGASMKLMFAGAANTQSSVQAKYIGVQVSRSIVAAVPPAARGTELKVGARVAVSMVSATAIATFTTVIEAVNNVPFAHVFLAYPDAISVRKVRSAARVNVGVSAEVTNLSAHDHLEVHHAQILDMSINGLKLASKEILGQIGEELAVQVQLSFDNIERNIMLNGNIRSQSLSTEVGNPFPHLCGVEFASLDEDKRVLLYAFVFCMIQRFGPQM